MYSLRLKIPRFVYASWPLIATLSLTGTPACKNQASRPAPAAQNGSATKDGSGSAVGQPPPAAAADIALQQKLAAAIACINSISATVYDARKDYFRTVDPTRGPDNKMTVWIRRFVDQTGTMEKLATAVALTPAATELDNVMQAYAVVVKELTPLINQANDYYEKKSNQDDNAAKGKELHPALLAGFDKFEVVAKQLSDVVATMSRQRKEAGLAKMASDPAAQGEYLFAKGLLVAEDVIDLADVPFAQLDLPGLTAKADELEKSFAGVYAYIAAKTQPAIDGIASVESDMRDFVKATLALVRRKRNDKAFEKYELDQIATGHSELVDGSAGQVISEYNTLINSANHR